MRIQRATVGIAVFFAGAVLMALEIAAFRIVGRVFGTALRETTTVIAVFMTAMSIGYWGGGRLGDRRPSRSTLSAILTLAAVAIALVPWLDGAISTQVASSETSLSLHALVASLSLFFVPTVLLSAVSPVAIRLQSAQTTQSGRTAGSISALSTVGSIFGTVLTAFVLFDWLQSVDRTVLVLASVLVATTVIVLLGDSNADVRSSGVAFYGRLALAICGVGISTAAIAYTISSTTPGGRGTSAKNVLYDRDSRYHHVVVRQHGGGTFRILQLDAATIQSSMIVRDPAGPGLGYTNYLHFAKTARPEARSMLLIGLGGGTAAKQFLRFYPDVTIDAVELDPLVAEVAQKLFFVSPSARLRLHVSDGRVFLASANRDQAWDIISVDCYTTNRYGSTIPPHLVTREFFTEVKRHLVAGGVFHFHCFAGLNSPIARALDRTLADVFPTVVQFSRTGYTEFFASANPISKDDLVRRATRLPWFDAPAAAKELVAERTSSAQDPILTDDYAPVDTLLGRH